MVHALHCLTPPIHAGCRCYRSHRCPWCVYLKLNIWVKTKEAHQHALMGSDMSAGLEIIQYFGTLELSDQNFAKNGRKQTTDKRSQGSYMSAGLEMIQYIGTLELSDQNFAKNGRKKPP